MCGGGGGSRPDPIPPASLPASAPIQVDPTVQRATQQSQAAFRRAGLAARNQLTGPQGVLEPVNTTGVNLTGGNVR